MCCVVYTDNAVGMVSHTSCCSVFVGRRDRERASALNLSTDADTDLLDFEEHFSSPSSFYAGTGGKPPLAFSIDSKPSRKR